MKVPLIATKKQDLFDIAEVIVDGIDPVFMTDPQHPVIVSIKGSGSAGKKIFPDVARQKLLGDTALCSLVGKEEYDEFWTKAVNGRMLEVDFVNIAWEHGYKSPVLKKVLDDSYLSSELRQKMPAALCEAFLAARQYGGLSYIHNYTFNASIDIWVECHDKDIVHDEACRRKNSPLSEVYQKAAQKEKDSYATDLRYLEIEIKDGRLAQSPVMMQALEDLRKATEEITKFIVSPSWQVWKRASERPYQPSPARKM